MDVFGLGLKIKEEGAATVQASLKRLAGQMLSVTAVVGGIGLAFKKLIDESSQLQAEQAALAAVLKSTNGVSGQTIDTLNAHADALAKVTAFSGGEIAETQKLLLTFTNIRGVFQDATTAALDMAQTLQMDASSAAMLLGKALNDPIAGVGSLAKAGVKLNEEQKKSIAQFIQQNDVMSAQKVILDELNSQVEGSATAYRNTLGGALKGVKNAFDDLFEVSAEDTRGLTDALNALAEWMPKIRDDLNVTAAYWSWRFSQVGKTITSITIHLDAVRFAFLKLMDTLHREGPTEIPQLTEARKQFQESIKELKAYDEKIEKAFARLGEAYSVQDMGGARRVTPAGPPPVEARTGTAAAEDALDKLRLQRQEEREAATLKRAIAGFQAYLKEKERLQAEADAKADAARREFIRKGVESDLKEQMKQFTVDINNIPLMPIDKALIRKLHLEGLKMTLADGIRNAVESGIMSGMEMAIVSGRIGDSFKAMGQAIVRSMASAMVRVALEAIKFGNLMKSIQAFMVRHPALAVASAIAMLALARSLGGSVEGGSMSAIGGPGGLSYGAAGATSPAQQIIFGATSATTAAGMTPRQSMNVTVIGPNDPSAQRAIQELMMKADSRGRIG